MSKAKNTSRKRAAANDYESDGGFVEDAPKSKKSKGGNAKPAVDLEMKKDDDGNAFWDISGKKRIQINEFKGNTLVNIREYYEKDGKMLPGKKGIPLTIDQYTAFVELLPQIESVLKSKGIQVPRPTFDSHTIPKPGDLEDEDEKEEEVEKRGEDEEEAPVQSAKSKLAQFRHKQNHEATSDEDGE